MRSTPTRRTILAGAVTLPALAAPATASSPANVVDQKLSDLFDELTATHVEMQKAGALCSQADRKYQALRPPEPENLSPPAALVELWNGIKAGELDLLRMVMPDHPLVVWEEQTREERSRIWDGYVERRKAAWATSGYDEVQENFDAWMAGVMEIYAEIMAVPAQSIRGILFKVQAIELIDIADQPDEWWKVIAADIRRVAGRAVQP